MECVVKFEFSNANEYNDCKFEVNLDEKSNEEGVLETDCKILEFLANPICKLSFFRLMSVVIFHYKVIIWNDLISSESRFFINEIVCEKNVKVSCLLKLLRIAATSSIVL